MLRKQAFFISFISMGLFACAQNPTYKAGYAVGLSGHIIKSTSSTFPVKPPEKVAYCKGWRAGKKVYCLPKYAEAQGALGKPYEISFCDNDKGVLQSAWLLGVRDFCFVDKAYQAGLKKEVLLPMCLRYGYQNKEAYAAGKAQSVKWEDVNKKREEIGIALVKNSQGLETLRQTLQKEEVAYYHAAFIPEKEIFLHRLRQQISSLDTEKEALLLKQESYQATIRQMTLYSFKRIV